MMLNYGHFINGEWRTSEETISVYDKYNGEEIATIGKASRGDVSDAVENALETFESTKLTPSERYTILMKASTIIQERKEELALTLVSEVGKVLKDARTEIDRGVATLVASAEEAKRLSGTGVPLNEGDDKIAYTIKVPVGVIGAITPFNFPFNLTIHKIGPALAAGNTVVLKPTQSTPIIACKLVEILIEAGLPAGFLNLVNGSGRETGEYMLEDERINMFTFTGSPQVGRHIKSKTGIRKVALELGNNSPNIVHKDAPNIQKAAELCVRSGFSNAGQACISVQRVYVHKDVYEEFIGAATTVAKSIKVGNPSNPEMDMGPMITEDEAKRAKSWVDEAVADGAKVVTGGGREGSILEPTILIDTLEHMKVVCEEVFAPVISIIQYDDIEEVFNKANDSNMGLQVGLFTSDLNLAMVATQTLQFGGVNINNVSTYRADIMPYGGVKDSGIGKEGPSYAIQEMTEEKLVVIHIEKPF